MLGGRGSKSGIELGGSGIEGSGLYPPGSEQGLATGAAGWLKSGVTFPVLRLKLKFALNCGLALKLAFTGIFTVPSIFRVAYPNANTTGIVTVVP